MAGDGVQPRFHADAGTKKRQFPPIARVEPFGIALAYPFLPTGSNACWAKGITHMAGKIIGIDLGTTNSVVAVMEGGQPKVLINASGARTTPSVVGFTEKGERLVGQPARHQQVTNPKNTVFSIKRFMGRRHDEVEHEEKLVPYTVVGGPQDLVKVDVRGKQFTPPEVSAMILQELKKVAEDYLGEKVDRAKIEELLENSPFIHKANTLEELAEMMAVDQATFLDTIASYNDAFAKGLKTEPAFGKPLGASKPFDTPPYYAIQIFPLARKNFGGVKTDMRCRVLDKHFEPIKGLYAAGELAGMAGGHINGKAGLEGTMLGPSLFSGRVAGGWAAQEAGHGAGFVGKPNRG